MTTASPTAYTVVPAELTGDRHRLLEVLNRNTSDALAAVSPARLAWLLDANPAGASTGWFLTHGADRTIVGTGSLVPRVMQVDGRSAACVRASLLAVDAGHRSFGPAAMIARRGFDDARERGFPTVLGVTPPGAVPIFARCGYVRVGDYVRYAKPLSLAPHLAARTGVAALAPVLAALPDLVLRLVSRDTWVATDSGRVAPLAAFDDRVDRLWERAGPAYGFTTVRSSAFLRWRFTECPDTLRFSVLGAFGSGSDDLQGYVVLAAHERHAYIYDLFADRRGPAADRLLAAAVAWARERRAQTISMWMAASPAFADGLARFGFRPRSDGPKPTALQLAGYDAALMQRIAAGSWYIVAADNA